VRRRRLVAVAALAWAAGVAGAWATAEARPVRIGRYTEIPYGVPEHHPYVTGGGDEHRTGRVPVEAPTATPTKRWETRLRAGRPSAPTITTDGTAYLASAAGIAAIAPDGNVQWSVRLGYVSGTPSLTPTGDLAVGTHAGAVVLVSPQGEVRDRTVVGGAVRGSPLVLADGSVVVSAFDQAVHRFDAEGRRIFRAPLAQQVNGAPAWTHRGEVVVPAADRLYLLTARGDARAEVPLGDTIAAGPIVADDGTLWVLTRDSALHQLSPRGALRSRTDIGFPVSAATGMAVGRDAAVRVPTRGDALVCIGPGGVERWRLTGEGGFLGGVTLDANDVALAVSERGVLIAVDPDGSPLWRVETGTRTDMAPVLGPDGTVYVVDIRGTLQAWR